MIVIRNIWKSFGTNDVLKGIDFEFEKGKVNMVIGASGSGKSVLVKNVVGLMTPNQGQVFFEDRDFYALPIQERREIRKDIGMLFQFSALFDSMTVAQNVAFPLKTFTNKSQHEIDQRVQFCLSRVNLHNVDHLYPAEISGGMKKRVGIARAIANNPCYLFCDEPNSGLDPQTASLIDKLIQELTYEYKTTTVVISHDMNSVVNIGDKIMFIHQGKKAWEGSRFDIRKTDNPIVNAFVFVSDWIRHD
ncbi:MAG: ATP-binding cassette domain-containing protein [Bacteroidia bacterium]|nr:ATP-binding cassette domain-containing protein [Bacteroidia bacterium]